MHSKALELVISGRVNDSSLGGDVDTALKRHGLIGIVERKKSVKCLRCMANHARRMKRDKRHFDQAMRQLKSKTDQEKLTSLIAQAPKSLSKSSENLDAAVEPPGSTENLNIKQPKGPRT